VCSGSTGDSAVDDRVSVPQTVRTRPPHLQRSQPQVFAFPARPLLDGMCGGPAVFCGPGAEVVGLLEGVVPADHPQALLRGAAVFVEAAEILRFLRAVEAGQVTPRRGGGAGEVVAADQDPAKMDLSSML